MFIVKLEYGNAIKKIKFLEEYQNITRLRQVVKDITNYDQFKLSFVDLEDEKIYLEDDHDMEYFLAQSEDKQRKIIIEDLSSLNNDEFIDIQKCQFLSSEIKEKKNIDDSQEQLKEELKDLILREDDNVQVNNEEESIPKIYQQKDTTIEKVKFPKLLKKIKKQKTSAQMLKKLKNTMNKTEQQLKKKLFKMQRQIKKIENAQKKESEQNKKETKITIVEEKPKQNGVRILTQHLGYVCDKCEKGPIIGVRYHCVVCPNYDLCSTCESQSMHTHPMLRIINQQSKQSIEKVLNQYLNNDDQLEIMQFDKCNDEQEKEKIELLNFMFPVKDEMVQKELVNRYRHLNIEEFYEELSKICKQTD